MANQLSQQAEYFQKYVDPIYDFFILDLIMINDPAIFQNKTKSESSNNNKKYMKHMMFASLSILTCGNNILRGFINTGHKDDDYITLSCIQSCYTWIKNINESMCLLQLIIVSRFYNI